MKIYLYTLIGIIAVSLLSACSKNLNEAPDLPRNHNYGHPEQPHNNAAQMAGTMISPFTQ